MTLNSFSLNTFTENAYDTQSYVESEANEIFNFRFIVVRVA